MGKSLSSILESVFKVCRLHPNADTFLFILLGEEVQLAVNTGDPLRCKRREKSGESSGKGEYAQTIPVKEEISGGFNEGKMRNRRGQYPRR